MDELFKNTAYRIFEHFMKHPRKFFSIRCLSDELGVNHGTVGRYIKDIHALGLLRRTTSKYPLYKANLKNVRFFEYRKQMLLFEYENKPEVRRHKGQKGYIM